MPAPKFFPRGWGWGSSHFLGAKGPQKCDFARRRRAFYDKSVYLSKIVRKFVNSLTKFSAKFRFALGLTSERCLRYMSMTHFCILPPIVPIFWLSTRYFGLFRWGGPPTFRLRVGDTPTFGPAREMARSLLLPGY